MKILIYILTLLILATSCKKKKLIKVHPEMQGNWKHWISENEWEQFIINEHGAGKIRNVKDGNDTGGDVRRAWYIKDDYLMWAWSSTIKTNGYKIDQYPTTAESFFIDGLDTVKIGNVYIKLKGKTYVDSSK